MVTIPFGVRIGSTSPGETTDPTALSGLLERYFEPMRTALAASPVR